MTHKFLFLLIFIASLILNIEAKTYKIGTYKIPNLVDDKQHGIFINFLKEIEKRTKIKFKIVCKPPKRIFNEFKENRIDAYFPAFKNNLPKKAILSETFFYKKIFLFTYGNPNLTNELIDNIKQLEGKKIGLTFGYSYPKELTSNKKIKFDYNINIKTSLQKLIAKRIDAFISDINTTFKVIKQNKFKNIICSSKALSITNVYFAFQQTTQGKEVATKFTKAIKDMKKDGTYDKIITNLIK